MKFDLFQTETGTLKKITLNGTGSESVKEEIEVECHVEWTRSRVINEDGEEITANAQVFITPDDKIDISHKRWDFEFEGADYKVEKLGRVKDIGTNDISHFEAMIR